MPKVSKRRAKFIDSLSVNRDNLPSMEEYLKRMNPLVGLDAACRNRSDERTRRAKSGAYFKHEVLAELLWLSKLEEEARHVGK